MLLAVLLSLGAFAPASDTIAIRDVSVLPMDRQRVLEHQTIVMADGRVISLGSVREVVVPRGATVVEGKGKFVIPGLSDMHVHLSTADELPMYVGNGVLTVRDLNGSPETLEWRGKVASGAITGPRILASGPMLAGGAIPWRNKVMPQTAAEAEAIVKSQKAAGYDQIKIYDGISKDVFTAAIATARQVGLASSGHIPADVGFEGVLASGMGGLEHLDKTVAATVNHDFDTLKIASIVERIRKSGMWVTPTLESMIQIAKLSSGRYDSLINRPEALASPKELRDFWTSVSVRLKGSRVFPAAFKYGQYTDYQMRLAGALARAGVPLMTGTDLPNAVLVPGYSLHGELDALAEAGLTAYQVLEASTSAPSRFFGQQADWGTVAVGQRANLVVTDQNPLDSMHTLRAPFGVVLGGKWLSAAELQQMRRGQ